MRGSPPIPPLCQASSVRLFCTELLMQAGLPARDAATSAEALVLADLRGIASHGVNRLPHYIERIESGTLNPRPNIRVEDLGPAVARVDGDCGMGQVALSAATDEAIRRGARAGVGWISVKNTNHCGALPYFGLRIAEAGMIGIVMTHTDPAVAPHGAIQPFLGTNPLCIALPGKPARSICLDFATSVVAWNKVVDARVENKPVPLGWGMDASGNDTTDPHEIAALYPFGGHKGSGLAIVIDLLSALLSGAPFGADSPPMYAVESQRRLGAVVCAVNATAFASLKEIQDRTSSYISRLHGIAPRRPAKKVMYPGEPEAITARQNAVSGIRLSTELLEQLRDLSVRYHVPWSIVAPGPKKNQKVRRPVVAAAK